MIRHIFRQKVLDRATAVAVSCNKASPVVSKNYGKALMRCMATGAIEHMDDPIEGADRKVVTLIPGDGVGPELCAAVQKIFRGRDRADKLVPERSALNSAGVPVDWDIVPISEIGPYGSMFSIDDVKKSIEKTKVALKGALTTPSSLSSQGHLSLTQKLKTELDLFANVVHCRSLPSVQTRHKNIDIVIVREQTEGEYSSLEHESVPGVVEMIKVVTAEKSERIAKFAFDFAIRNKRKKVTAVHKANIMKLGDGLFLETCKSVAKLYPKIKFEGMIVDNACMQLVSNPSQFDVMVLPNLYGSIVDNIGAGLVGGAGVVPGKSFGKEYAIFEPGARHTYAQVAGRNVANPTAMLLSACDMLEHLHLFRHARMVREALLTTIEKGKVLPLDMGGSAGTSDFIAAVIQNLKAK